MDSELEGKIPSPKLIWPHFKYDVSDCLFKEVDSEEFTDIECIYNNHTYFEVMKKKGKYLGCKEFWDKFRESRDIVFIDRYFDEFCYGRTYDEVKDVSTKYDYEYKNIKIFCEKEFKNVFELNQLMRNDIGASIKVIQMPDIIHDRFALMDGEIWHCGSTIGGMHNSLNALSRGWKDHGNKMKKFIERLEG